MAILKDWTEWKNTLGNAVELGENVGMSDDTITNVAEKVGTFLANNVDPRNPEERLLKEMWDVSDINDKNVLAKLIVRITSK
ncbi:DUF3243 domain-containing protein [Clostridium folliculivorans]|uniref:DUF3243 domain-containing protein n=1 Tax=Clostridium folliculivorans TaxID=2886038 RepID=A0A9W5Y5D8_9CLOT|nr:DUF3243 domain-containing protein [Clostridium folliculivorans]GKU26981.1 hypothetical protein CFOLD11_38080 [Clostridium folliculivorans]GKU29177.1 hypothetical protein CFB3_12830 [Clostridium folliculivorans]